ncbi:hypothetical protein G7Y89_g815 [Cudoniella acicularis]|uniref:RING-type domain-containing protein n=1 Tax=Cudoniella acicularis TaxID=354080 RepID=A0A8H4RY46_9HELO|nr:hypothetical protein G7Y89_g815 [Cudoniella acicularis]
MRRSSRLSVTWLRFSVFGILLVLGYLITSRPDRTRVQPDFPSYSTDSNACINSPLAGNVVVSVKTGASEATERLPAQMQTTLRCAKNVVFFSDLEQDVKQYHLHDSLDTISTSVIDNNPDFVFYRKQAELWKSEQDISSLKGFKHPESHKELAAWTLDKYKNVHILEKTWALKPNMDWYIFIDADTYIFWSNMLMWLETMDPMKKSYFGSEVNIDNTRFAHGGTGIIISKATMYELAVTHNGTAERWDPKIHEKCCGDLVLGLALKEFGTELQDVWPLMSGETQTSMPFGPGTPEYWCRPALSLHHLSPTDMKDLDEFERGRPNSSDILNHVELFKSIAFKTESRLRPYSRSSRAPRPRSKRENSTISAALAFRYWEAPRQQCPKTKLCCSMSGPNIWLEIPATDLTRVQKFYSTIFGWSFKPVPMPNNQEEYITFNKGTLTGGFIKVSPENFLSPAAHPDNAEKERVAVRVTLTVDSLDETLKRVVEAGGGVYLPKREIPNDMGFVAFFTDSERNVMASNHDLTHFIAFVVSMDVTDAQLTAVVQEAFTCYLGLLSHTQTLHEVRGKGKAVETTVDLSTQQSFQARITAAEACLQHTERIARSIQQWASEPPEEVEGGVTLEGADPASMFNFFDSFLQDEDEQPYLDIFTGKWIWPTTLYSAGPSGTQGLPDELDNDAGRSQEYSSSAPRNKQRSATNLWNSKSPSYKNPSPDVRSSNPLSNSSTPPSNRSSQYESLSSASSVGSDEEFMGETDIAAANLKAKLEIEAALHRQDVERRRAEREYTGGTDMATANLKAQLDIEAALNLHEMERKRAEEEEYNLALAQRLADEWAREEENRIYEQERFARELEMDEAKSIAEARRLAEVWAREDVAILEGHGDYTRKLREKAKAMDDDLMFWGTNQQSPMYSQQNDYETQDWRFGKDGSMSRDEDERAEAEQNARIEMESGWEALSRAAGEAKKKEKANQNRGFRNLRPRQDSIKAPLKKVVFKPAKPIVCISCMEPGEKDQIITLPCKHNYCGECLAGAFKAALKSKTPFKCCNLNVPLTVTNGTRFLSASFTKNYTTFLLELNTKNPPQILGVFLRM